MHRRMVGREAVPPGILHQVRDPVRPVLADDQPQDPVAARGCPDPGPVQARHPARDELLDDALRVDDPEGGVARPNQLAHAIHDDLEDAVEGQDCRHGADRGVERGQPLISESGGSAGRLHLGRGGAWEGPIGPLDAVARRKPVRIGGARRGGVGHSREGNRPRHASPTAA